MRSLILLPLMVIVAMANQPLTYQVEHINLPDDKAAELMHATMDENSTPLEMIQNWKMEGIATSASGGLVAAASSDAPSSEEYDPFSGEISRFGMASISGHVEWLYATEFDPMEIPDSIEVTNQVKITEFMHSPAMPTAFESRNVGIGLEFVSAGETGNALEISTQITENFGTSIMGQGEARCWMPDFYNSWQKQTIKPGIGNWMLLAATEAGPSEPGITTTTWLRVLNSSPTIPDVQPSSSDAHLTLVAEWYTIDASAVDQWLKGLTADPDDSALHDSLQQLVADGKAHGIAKRLLTTRSGDSTRSEAQKEMIYSTEYEPPGPACGNPNTDQPNDQPLVEQYRRKLATAFETRNLGPSITIDPVIHGDSKFIECGITAHTVEHDINHNMGSLDAAIHMPFFVTTNIKTRTFLENGKPRLIGVCSKPIRTFPAVGIKQSDDIEKPPQYQLNNTPRTVLFLTAKVAK